MSAERVVVSTDQHLLEAVPATLELLSLLPELKVAVQVGGRAERGWTLVAPHLPHAIPTLCCPHPSPVNPRPQAAAQTLTVLGQARRLCS